MRCNICDEILSHSSITAHLASRNHSIKKKVAEYNEMNSLLRRTYENDDRSVLQVWITGLYAKDAVSRESQA